MRRLFLLLLLVRVASAQSTASKHTIDVQVVGSRLVPDCGGWGDHTSCAPVLHINAVIEGHQYELVSERITALLQREILELGNYKARLVKEKHSKPYRTYKEYEIEYPDGETEQFFLVGETVSP